EAFGIAAGEDDVGPLGPCASSCLEADACTAADHHDGPSDQFRFAGGNSSGSGGHDFLRCVVVAIIVSVPSSGRIVDQHAEFLSLRWRTACENKPLNPATKLASLGGGVVKRPSRLTAKMVLSTGHGSQGALREREPTHDGWQLVV